MSQEAIKLRDVTRSKDPMYALCKERLITNEACDWVKSALDPFHDLQLERLCGYPDVSTEPTVVVKIRQAVTVARPEGLDPDANWDCHIVLSPIDWQPGSQSSGARVQAHGAAAPQSGAGSMADAAGVISTYGVATGGSPPYDYLPQTARFDGLVINSVPANEANDTNMTFTPGHMPVTPGGGYACTNINLDDYLDYDETDLGVYRVIYSGFEVVNTTAQIKKQGAVTVYEYGNSFEVGASMPRGIHDVTGPAYGNVQGLYSPTTYFRSPPNTLAQAKIMPGSHSWAAQDGCYNTGKFQTENPFQAAAKRPWAICQNQNVAGDESGYFSLDTGFPGQPTAHNCGSVVSEPRLGGGVVTLGTSPPDFGNPGGMAGACHFSRMNTTGAYFTGLSHESTLFVTWRVGIERLPAANKPTFLALAQPSATYDPSALVLYNLVANVLPPGCPQGYNDAGKWFRWISEAASKAIPTVYPAVRTAAMVANAMGRPVIGGALTGLEGMLKPHAENIAAKRLQQAARNKSKANNNKAPMQPRGRAAVGNWTQPSPRGVKPGGRNGLN